MIISIKPIGQLIISQLIIDKIHRKLHLVVLQLPSLLLTGQNMLTLFNPRAKLIVRGPCNLHRFLDYFRLFVDFRLLLLMNNFAVFADIVLSGFGQF